MEAKIPGSSFDAGDTWLSWASVFSAVEARVYCYLKLLNLGSVNVRGFADSLKLLITCHVTMHFPRGSQDFV